ncbi:hypothetical protein [Actinomadura sp. DC4]|uniref:hypothetical protein n=1 Tax=Actinomadura sp. DC4 TaxID=3055069 RepID=UPI0025B13DE9|nr:hypothetical protein [Actinomadura sp. DC4]MDN3353714.1 hypothetical protein [Actinomadura sp. DC4]
MTADPYRITEASRPPEPAPGRTTPNGFLRPVLWLLLVISAAGNIATSSTGVSVFVSGAFGLATLGLGIALAAQHYRGRRK